VQHNKGNHTIRAGQSIEMKVGNSTLQMTPTCVTFKGNAIRLN